MEWFTSKLACPNKHQKQKSRNGSFWRGGELFSAQFGPTVELENTVCGEDCTTKQQSINKFPSRTV